jgi:hypothetical protein
MKDKNIQRLEAMEYREACAKDNGIAVGYTKFCTDYEKYTMSQNLTNHFEHKPGNLCAVDWSGPTMKIIAPVTAEIGSRVLSYTCQVIWTYKYNKRYWKLEEPGVITE